MTGRAKVAAAFSREGTREIPVVLCYEGIYIRDHWSQLTDFPWWYQFSPDLGHHVQWRAEVIEKTGQDWFALPAFSPRHVRENLTTEERNGEVFRVSNLTGEVTQLTEPRIGGWDPNCELQSVHPGHLVETQEEVDGLVPPPDMESLASLKVDGRRDLAARMLEQFGEEIYPICHVASPLWQCYSLWGFEGMMMMVALRPELVRYACERFLLHSLHQVHAAAALGAAGIWIEECLTDMVSPGVFAALNLPFVRQLVEAIRDEGMHSIYYYCGDPAGKWEALLSTGADALSLEESKKGFVIDVDEVVARADGRCAVLGNLDAVGVLQNGTEEQLSAELSRQIAAGRRNGSRFVVSLGSPVTPATPVERVRLYCDIARDLGCG